jgi:hypothetical protein
MRKAVREEIKCCLNKKSKFKTKAYTQISAIFLCLFVDVAFGIRAEMPSDDGRLIDWQGSQKGEVVA